MSNNTKKKMQPKRSLILAGGGMKVAFQAGVLQVWLDEAGQTFDHADGASGGVFNLAMYAQGMSGTQIADNWRALSPLSMIRPNWQSWLRGPYLKSLFSLDHLPSKVFPVWGLDWTALNKSKVDATFNVYNFSNHELTVLNPSELTPDLLLGCVSLPTWFPPVVTNGQHWIDAVYATDANIEHAIVDRGADEVWVIWTVDRSGTWRDGLIAQYFQTIEAAANAELRAIQKRITHNNDLFSLGETSEFGRHITVKMLEADVPLHYLINFSGDRNCKAVELGVKTAREWCHKEGITLTDPAPTKYPDDTTVSFSETMRGNITFATTPDALSSPSHDLKFHLDITVNGVDRFIAEPSHEAPALGIVDCDALGGAREVTKGWFNLFLHEDDPAMKEMRYRLWFTDSVGHPLTLVGVKTVRNDRGFDVWHDTTTLAIKILAGHIEADGPAEPIAQGQLLIKPLDFARQLTTFRSSGPTLARKLSALTRFGRSFIGDLWDVYARKWLPWGPF
ncbi:MAG: patatin-like phospholipase family protein [Acidimicrobiales bacterium]